MTREEIMMLDAEQIDARSAELASEIEKAETNEAMDAIQSEMEAIEERKAQIRLEVEQRKADMAAVIKGQGDVIEEVKDERKVTTMEVRNTPEYINAYAEYIKSGNDMECRKLTSENDTTPNGTGTVAVPEFVYDIVKTAWEREGIMSLVAFVLSLVHRTEPRRLLRTLFYLCLPQILLESLRSEAINLLFIHLEQLVCYLFLEGVLVWYALAKNRRSFSSWIPALAGLVVCGLVIACEFAVDGKIHIGDARIPEWIIYSVMACGLAALAAAEHRGNRQSL